MVSYYFSFFLPKFCNSDVGHAITIFFLFSKDSPTADEAAPDWRSVPLPGSTPGRHQNVARLRTLGGDPTCVPPDFNSSMLAIWEEMWHSIPQSGRISVTVYGLLQQYRERCRAERKRPRDASESPPALLPVSFALAKDWAAQAAESPI